MPSDSPAEAFPPGEFLRDELKARDWTQTDLAEILGRPARVVNEIIAGKRAITPETAKGLGDAFDTSAEFWLNLESAYQLWRVRDRDDKVERRARLYRLAPVGDMMRRNWITKTRDLDVLEREILRFLQIDSLSDEPEEIAHAAKKSTEELTREQAAWIRRVRQLAPKVDARAFVSEAVPDLISRLRELARTPEGALEVPGTLANAGIRFLVIEHLPKTKIDGVCLWLDSSSPVIALSVRYDRIDCFWHTLMHELGHVNNRDGLTDLPSLDTDIVGEGFQSEDGRSQVERAADDFAVGALIAPGALAGFIHGNRPLYSALKIQAFAASVGVHPGIVVGQLQHRGEIPYSTLRRFLVAVRQLVTSATLTDGWGSVLPKYL
ncbi:MAG: HigA family addiction module antitoxin [Chloroflexota bacterium]|nr:HigA family addiction module antitoxin [Chloroflexota bacterium]